MFSWQKKKEVEAKWKISLLKEDLSQKFGGKTIFSHEELKQLRNRFINLAHPSLGLVSRLSILEQPEIALNPLVYAAVDVLLYRNESRKDKNKGNMKNDITTSSIEGNNFKEWNPPRYNPCRNKEDQLLRHQIHEKETTQVSISDDETTIRKASQSQDSREEIGSSSEEVSRLATATTTGLCECGMGGCIYEYDEPFLSYDEYINLLAPFHPKSPRSAKLKLIQRMIDIDEDGIVSHEEVEKILCLLVGGTFPLTVLNSMASEIIESMEKNILYQLQEKERQRERNHARTTIKEASLSNSSTLKMKNKINALDLNKGQVRTADLIDVLGEQDITNRMSILF